ncbi:MAG: hypothetical protein SF123_15195 [Chloroflexota bacterium]|nr:hypothetical protein [Chloroflexota bacterium]
MNTFADTIHQWETFYFATGGIGATLAGLMFVAAALHFQRFQSQNNVPLRAWSSYTLAHFAQVILISLLFLVPAQTPAGLGLPLAASASIGLLTFLAGIAYVVRKRQTVRLYSWALYFIMPAALYGLMLVSALRVAGGYADLLPLFVIVIVGLLALGAQNCWNLVVHQRIPGVTEG